MVVALVIENRNLKDKLENFGKPPYGLKANDMAPDIDIRSLNGDSVHMSFVGRKDITLLFVFSVSCPSCLKSLPRWNMISDSLKKSECKVMGISINDIDRTIKYFNELKPHFPVFAAQDSLFKIHFKIGFVPQTILINKDGIVLNNWGGVIDSTKEILIRNDVMNRTNDNINP
jgi:peroxiredoxin